MHKLTLFVALVLMQSVANAQDGYFVKAGGGVGSSNSSFNIFFDTHNTNHQSILSGQGLVNIGRSYSNWQLEVGIGYLVTGLSFVLGPGGTGGCVVGPNPNPIINSQKNSVKYTISNPHLVLPLVVSYVPKIKSKFSVSPGIGLEALYNFQGKMTATGLNEASGLTMDYKYNSIAAAVLLQLNFQYKINKNVGVCCSPSFQKMITSLTTNVSGDYMSRIYDHAVLVNVGVKYNFLKKSS